MTQKPFYSNWFVKRDYLPHFKEGYENEARNPGEKTCKNLKLTKELEILFQTKDLAAWLNRIVALLNQSNTANIGLNELLRKWTENESEFVFGGFKDTAYIQCINAIYFYKLYPDKLFNGLVHPEKLVSVQQRLSVLHQFIEDLQLHLAHFATLNGLEPELDYLLHGEELPQGIMIEISEELNRLIQEAIITLKIKKTSESEAKLTVERLQDLRLAYLYWFNPNRLIDATMVLRQRVVKVDVSKEKGLQVFGQEMIVLYGKLSTTECLNLYGYFSNKDTLYLLNTLNSLVEGKSYDWLPTLTFAEISAINTVFQALVCVMEALRATLKNRQVNTKPYPLELKMQLRVGKRNREAVHRIIAVYGETTLAMNESVEKLFCKIEGKEKD